MAELSHEDIAKRLIESEAIDFRALGAFVADVGPELAVHDEGLHGVAFGRYNLLACMMPAVDAAKLVGNLGDAARVTRAMDSDAG